MSEAIREIAVTIEIDTNKRTLRRKLHRQDDETIKQFEKRVGEEVADLLEQVS